MALAGKHTFGAIGEQRVTFIEKKIEEGRKEFLKKLLEVNGFEVIIQEEKIKTVRNRGILIVTLAFTIDNSETDFELEIEYREIAQDLGFKQYRVARCPNDSALFVDALAEIYKKMK